MAQLPEIYAQDPTIPVHYDRTLWTIENRGVFGHNIISYTPDIGRVGVRLDSTHPLIGISTKVVQVYCSKFGNPTGNISVVVRKGTDDTVGATIGTMDIANIVAYRPTSFIVRNRGNTYDNAVNDVVSVEFATSTNGNNGFSILTNANLTTSTAITGRQHNGTAWSTIPASAGIPAMLIKGSA